MFNMNTVKRVQHGTFVERNYTIYTKVDYMYPTMQCQK